MNKRPRITVDERRARLIARHHLGRTAASPDEAVRAVVALHSSDPITPPLALWARIPGFATADLERSLYEDRTLWRLHAMRRTLFVVHTADAPVVIAACSRDIAQLERRRLERWVADALGEDEVSAWLARVEDATLAVLADGRPRHTQELGGLVEELSLQLTTGSGKWVASVPLSTRLLSLLAFDAGVVRAHPAGSWLSSQYAWADRRRWFRDTVTGGELDTDPAEARAKLACAYLRAYGPVTTADLRWWTGWGARVTAAALDACDVVEVDLGDGAIGVVLADDVDTVTEGVPSVALLPGLDPTTMGWKERSWYLGDHAVPLFDRNGNAGPTIWANGRVVGAWAVAAGGEVVTRTLEDVGREHDERIVAEAARLTGWLAGVRPTPRFRTPLERELSGPAGP